MAPTKPPKPTKTSNKARKPSAPSSSKLRSSSKIKRPPPKQQKTKPNLHNPSASQPTKAKKKPKYTDKQLNIPAVNAITPANAAPSAPNNLNSKGKKRKIFVDDEESMRTILGIVQAEREGEIESKMIRLRKMEEIRAARQAEAEKRESQKGKALGKVMEEVKRGKWKKRKSGEVEEKGKGKENREAKEGRERKRKKVAFA